MGISVDSPEKNTAMTEKLLLPFPLLSDEEGKVIKEYGVWDEKGEISRTALFVVGKDRQILYRYTGEDFADRPGDQELFMALEIEGEEQS